MRCRASVRVRVRVRHTCTCSLICNFMRVPPTHSITHPPHPGAALPLLPDQLLCQAHRERVPLSERVLLSEGPPLDQEGVTRSRVQGTGYRVPDTGRRVQGGPTSIRPSAAGGRFCQGAHLSAHTLPQRNPLDPRRHQLPRCPRDTCMCMCMCMLECSVLECRM